MFVTGQVHSALEQASGRGMDASMVEIDRRDFGFRRARTKESGRYEEPWEVLKQLARPRSRAQERRQVGRLPHTPKQARLQKNR
jgi:hypothetical protein